MLSSFIFHRFTNLIVCLILFLSGAIAQHIGLMDDFDQRVLDAEFRFNRVWFPQPVSNDPIIVGIDEDFLSTVDEPLALNHLYLSRFLTAMTRAQPGVIGVDLILPEKRFDTLASTRDPDLDFHKVLLGGLLQATQQMPLIAAKVWDYDRNHFRDVQVDYAGVLSMQSGVAQPLASALFCPDSDGRIRRYPGKDCQPDGGEYSFSSEVGGAIGVRQSWSGLINYQLGGAFTYISLRDVLLMAERGDDLRLRQLFKGKAVLLGVVLDDVDLLELPVAMAEWRPGSTRVPGVLAHAQALRSMFNNGLIQYLPKPVLWFACGLFALFWLGESTLRKTLLFAIVVVVLTVFSDVLLWYGYWLPTGAMLLTGGFALGARGVWLAWQNFRDKQVLIGTFSGYVSPSVMKEILSGELHPNQQGRKQAVCVLFSDIRNFTTMSERLPAEVVVSLLNRYFARMTVVIHHHGGTVDKFIGDGMMAFFGAPNLLACPEKNALDAAQAMLIALDELNQELVAEGGNPIAIGIGLHSGEAVIGHIGSPDRHEYTAIGDTVNTAARLEGLCKEVGFPIICSSVVAAAAGQPDYLLPLGEKHLKGRSDMSVYGFGNTVLSS
jgi:class 3 adenylate cyclase